MKTCLNALDDICLEIQSCLSGLAIRAWQIMGFTLCACFCLGNESQLTADVEFYKAEISKLVVASKGWIDKSDEIAKAVRELEIKSPGGSQQINAENQKIDHLDSNIQHNWGAIESAIQKMRNLKLIQAGKDNQRPFLNTPAGPEGAFERLVEDLNTLNLACQNELAVVILNERKRKLERLMGKGGPASLPLPPVGRTVDRK